MCVSSRVIDDRTFCGHYETTSRGTTHTNWLGSKVVKKKFAVCWKLYLRLYPRERRDYLDQITPSVIFSHKTDLKTGFCDKNWGQCAWYVEIWRPQPYPYLLGRTRQGARARALDGAQVEPLEFVWLEGRVRVGIWERATFGVGVRS